MILVEFVFWIHTFSPLSHNTERQKVPPAKYSVFVLNGKVKLERKDRIKFETLNWELILLKFLFWKGKKNNKTEEFIFKCLFDPFNGLPYSLASSPEC